MHFIKKLYNNSKKFVNSSKIKSNMYKYYLKIFHDFLMSSDLQGSYNQRIKQLSLDLPNLEELEKMNYRDDVEIKSHFFVNTDHYYYFNCFNTSKKLNKILKNNEIKLKICENFHDLDEVFNDCINIDRGICPIFVLISDKENKIYRNKNCINKFSKLEIRK